MLIVHGATDPVVKLDEAENLLKWNPKSQLVVIENTAHTFDTKHPWNKDELPQAFSTVVDKTIVFLGE